MAESERTIVNQVTVEAVTAVMTELMDADVGPRTATNKSCLKSHWDRDMADPLWKSLHSSGIPWTGI